MGCCGVSCDSCQICLAGLGGPVVLGAGFLGIDGGPASARRYEGGKYPRYDVLGQIAVSSDSDSWISLGSPISLTARVWRHPLSGRGGRLEFLCDCTPFC